MAATELNFTRGLSERFVPSTSTNVKTTHIFSLIGLDLIFSFAKRTENYIPYVKFGLGYFLEKTVTFEFRNNTSGVIDAETQKLTPTLVPSAGFGIKIRISEELALKLGIEAWTSDGITKKPDIDWAGKAGISWFF
jgi:hypothetical protein